MVSTKYPNLPAHLRKWGLRVEEVSGWQTRSANTTTFTPNAVIAHHTAGGLNGNAPSLGYIIKNRLSQFVLGRDGTVYLVSGNRANHAGVGGPIAGIPKDAGNRYAWGIEAENNGIGEPWSQKQLDAYYRLTAALLDMMKQPASKVIAHREWAPNRKVDPRGIDMGKFRAAVDYLLKTGPGGTPGPVLEPVLMLGDEGPKVTELQHRLNYHGFKCSVDGDFGPATEGKVKEFQAAKGLEVDGIVGQRTWTALKATRPGPAPTPTPTTGGKRMLIQFKGSPYVYEIVGSVLWHVTAKAWKARGLKPSDVTILPADHPMSELYKAEEY